MQRILAQNVTLTLVLSAIVVAGWWLPNRLQDPGSGAASTAGAGKFNSLSYAAYRPGESPLADRFATLAEVEQDLALLAPLTRAIRTYAAIEGPYDIPAVAQRHGLRVWQGIWLGGDRARNALEMARAIEMAHRYPDTIERVVVGNEVLLRRDLPAGELIADIDHVRAAVRQPVAYADVSDFWDQFPQVAPHVDVVLIHLLPYWEDVPTGIDHAVDAVGSVYTHFTRLFPGKVVAIGETGWPSRGRQRRDAVPGLINEARFLRGFMALAAARRFDYNFIEAFDQDWKYANEGIVGANWGLATAQRTPKIPPAGPLREDPDWAAHAAGSVAAGLLLAGIGMVAGRRRTGPSPATRTGPSPATRTGPSPATRTGPSPATQPQILLLAMTLGAALGIAYAATAPVLYDAHAALAGVVNLGGQALLAGLAVRRLSGGLAPATWRTGADATRRVTQLLRLRRTAWAGLFEDLCFLFAWTAGVEQILLVFDPRYREFPVASFAVPLVVIAARAARGDLPRGIGGREELLAAATLACGAVASAIQEGAYNAQSLRWNACVLVLSAPLWISAARRPRTART